MPQMTISRLLVSIYKTSANLADVFVFGAIHLEHEVGKNYFNSWYSCTIYLGALPKYCLHYPLVCGIQPQFPG